MYAITNSTPVISLSPFCLPLCEINDSAPIEIAAGQESQMKIGKVFQGEPIILIRADSRGTSHEFKRCHSLQTWSLRDIKIKKVSGV